jgi:hypothetical protein
MGAVRRYRSIASGIGIPFEAKSPFRLRQSETPGQQFIGFLASRRQKTNEQKNRKFHAAAARSSTTAGHRVIPISDRTSAVYVVFWRLGRQKTTYAMPTLLCEFRISHVRYKRGAVAAEGRAHQSGPAPPRRECAQRGKGRRPADRRRPQDTGARCRRSRPSPPVAHQG